MNVALLIVPTNLTCRVNAFCTWIDTHANSKEKGVVYCLWHIGWVLFRIEATASTNFERTVVA
jgi:hypothetical protein